MAGGFAQAYKFCDPLKNSGSNLLRDDDYPDFTNTTNPRTISRESELEQQLNTLRACDDEELSSDDVQLGGGRVLSSAWMYDGFSWNSLPPMSTPRDRPACSLAQLEDGSVS